MISLANSLRGFAQRFIECGAHTGFTPVAEKQLLLRAAERLEELECAQADRDSTIWNPMSDAPKNGTPLLLKFRDDLDVLHPARDDVAQWHGIQAVLRHSTFEWNFAAPVGMGGFPDHWFVGWRHLPE